jgi:ribosomal protein S27AE
VSPLLSKNPNDPEQYDQEKDPMLSRKMICTECGDEMNHHADKLTYPTKGDNLNQANHELGGVLEETHACPGCGAVASRRAE